MRRSCFSKTLPRILSSKPAHSSALDHASMASPPFFTIRPAFRASFSPFHSSSSSSCFISSPSLHAAASQPCYPDSSSDDDRGPFSHKVLRLRDEIASLTDEELTQMSAALRKKLGLPEPPSMDAAALGAMQLGMQEWQEGGAPQAAAEEKPPEKTSFNVKLEKFEAASKIKVIKEVRACTDLGLKEAKEFVEKTPAVLKTGLSKEDATQIIEKLKAVGATAIME